LGYTKLFEKKCGFFTFKRNMGKFKLPEIAEDDNDWNNWIMNKSPFEIREIKKMMMIKIQEIRDF
jgi:succinate dehydrogenase flavin-adding protein (antitoxin of CptAB toxin-antitoxin module)